MANNRRIDTSVFKKSIRMFNNNDCDVDVVIPIIISVVLCVVFVLVLSGFIVKAGDLIKSICLLEMRLFEYYKSITYSTSEGKSNIFILFMLNCLNKAVIDLISNTKNHINHINNQLKTLLEVIEDYPQSAVELMQKLNLKSRVSFRNNYLKPGIDMGLIGLTEPNKPTSKNQKYFKI